ncbi:MAG: hypothetical protein AAF634_04090 [Bacteroidota bacterium]
MEQLIAQRTVRSIARRLVPSPLGYMLCLGVLLCSYNANGQARLITLEPDIFLGTTFNGVSLAEVEATQGNQNTIQQQFGFSFNRQTSGDTDFYWANYESVPPGKDVLLVFNDEDDNGTLELTGVRIRGPQTPVVVAGSTIRVGDAMTLLGLDPNAPNVSEKLSWVYKTELGGSIIYVKYDPVQFVINEIGYLSN